MMLRSRFRRSVSTRVLFAFVTAIVMLGYIGGVGSAETDQINACSSGDRFIRFVDSPAECGRGETAYTWNVAGPQGPAGQNGADGKTWYSGAGVPDGALGTSGDLYFDSTNGDVYTRGDDAWTLITNITGPQGQQGPEGPQGPAGATGATGATGAAGPTGASGAPDTPHTAWIGRWSERSEFGSGVNDRIDTLLYVYNPPDSDTSAHVSIKAYGFSDACSGPGHIFESGAFTGPGVLQQLTLVPPSQGPPFGGCLSITSDEPIFVSGVVSHFHTEVAAFGQGGTATRSESHEDIAFFPIG